MIRMFIDNEEVVCNKEFTITEEMLKTSSTVLNNCYPKSWEQDHDYTSRFYFPPDYSKCLIYKDDELIFCGVVKNTGNISLNPRDPHFSSIQILDFKTFLSEGDTLDFVINNKTVSQAINMIIDVIKQYGFQVGNIQILNDEIIGAYSTLNKTAYDVFNYLADISQTRWTTRMLNENKVAIDFYDPTLLPQVDDIQYNSTYYENNNIQDIKYSYSTNDYRNKQVMLSDKVYGNVDFNETKLADGYNKTFTTDNEIAVIKGISVNDTPVTFATNDDKELGIEADFYYTPGTSEFMSNETSDAYNAGTEIEITYTPLIKGRQLILNNDEINRISNQTGRNGIIARYESRNDVLSSDELEAIGESYLKFKGTAEVKLTVKTYNKDLINVGQVSYFDAPINNLKTNYMCKKKKTTIIATTGDIFYEYELTNNYNAEAEINYFDNQRAKASGNIGVGEYIDRNIDILKTTEIIYRDESETEITATGDNILNCGLNSPLIK